MDINQHIIQVEKAAREWLMPDNTALQYAIERTVNEGLFSFEDIKFQIRALKQAVDAGQISEWAHRVGLDDQNHAVGKKVLCLHAGNLPLVGFQDALGTILSGATYFGKLSRKDPYLLPTFLEKVKKHLPKHTLQYTTDVTEYNELQADKVLFAGSEQSVESVKQRLFELNAATDSTEFVIRTAKFSMAYISDDHPNTVTDLVEAVFRYGGQGCRSVAVVVSPLRLNQLKCHFQDYIEAFWLKNPQHKKPEPALEYQFAYNKAIGKAQAWMNDFLLQESEEFPEHDFTLNWVQGDHNKLRELYFKFGTAVQTIYTAGEKIEGLNTEFLSQAQTPPLWWKPDGKEVIRSIL